MIGIYSFFSQHELTLSLEASSMCSCIFLYGYCAQQQLFILYYLGGELKKQSFVLWWCAQNIMSDSSPHLYFMNASLLVGRGREKVKFFGSSLPSSQSGLPSMKSWKDTHSPSEQVWLCSVQSEFINQLKIGSYQGYHSNKLTFNLEVMHFVLCWGTDMLLK